MGWKREIEPYRTKVESLDNLADDTILALASENVTSDYYLAHTLEGVIWGTPATLGEVPVNILTDLRVFNSSQQVHIWRDGDNWRSLFVQDQPDENGNAQAFDEYHILWGTSTEQQNNGIKLVEGAQGFRQLIPIQTTLPEFDTLSPLTQRVVMNVRHYLGEHDNGMNYVAFSRIIDIIHYDYLSETEISMGGV